VVEGPAPNPIAILFEELFANLHPASCPNAILFDPEIILNRAVFPIAVLWDPVLLKFKEEAPIAVLLVPVVLLSKAQISYCCVVGSCFVSE
jgi:hypothetical protein